MIDHKKFRSDFIANYQSRIHRPASIDVVAECLMDSLSDANLDPVTMAALGACVSQAASQATLLLDLEAIDPDHPVLRFLTDRGDFLSWALEIDGD